MSRRRRRRAPAGPKIAALAVAAIALALVIFLVVRLFSGALRLAGTSGSGRDPQFVEPAEAVTRPPELDGEGTAPELAEDPSLNWDLGEQTPVDKTAEELSREAAMSP